MIKQWKVIDYCPNSSILNVVKFMELILSQVPIELKYVLENF